MLRELQNEIKAKAKSVYSNLIGGAHSHIGIVITDARYALISKTPFFNLTHPVPLIVQDGTTAYMNSKMIITHTEGVCLFRKVMGAKQALVQNIFTQSRRRILWISLIS